jgi:hypothetical protein
MPTEEATRTNFSALLSFFVVLSIASFGLNWLWEMLQMPAYTEMAGRSWRSTAWTCTLATFGDVGITWIVCGLGTLAAGDRRWAVSGRWNVYVTVGLLSASAAVAAEWRALSLGLWSYNASMPVIPLLDVGLWPLLQLTLLTPLCVFLARRWCMGSPESGYG